MAIPKPQADSMAVQLGLLSAVLPEDRGTFDIWLPTKTSRQKSSVYLKKNACDEDTYIYGGISGTFNQYDEGCQLVQASSYSVNISLPWLQANGASTTPAQLESNFGVMHAFVVTELVEAMKAYAAANAVAAPGA